MSPTPPKVPSDPDSLAEEILEQARDSVTADLLGCLIAGDRGVLLRYGRRQVTAALYQRSVPLLRDALLAVAIGEATLSASRDWRDVLVRLAPFHFVAAQLGQSPAEIFGDVASRLPDGWVPDLFRTFGGRRDVTLEVFNWLLIQTPDGPSFARAPLH